MKSLRIQKPLNLKTAFLCARSKRPWFVIIIFLNSDSKIASRKKRFFKRRKRLAAEIELLLFFLCFSPCVMLNCITLCRLHYVRRPTLQSDIICLSSDVIWLGFLRYGGYWPISFVCSLSDSLAVVKCLCFVGGKVIQASDVVFM